MIPNGAAALMAVCWLAVCTSCDGGTSQGIIAQVSGKLPVPKPEAQKAAKSSIDEAYKAEFARANTPALRLFLARNLLHEAMETHDDPAGEYMLLLTVAELSSGEGDLLLAFEAIDQIDARFEVNAVELQVRMAKRASTQSETKSQKQLVAMVLSTVIEDAIAQDQYKLALDAKELALAHARQTEDEGQVADLIARGKLIQDLSTRFDALEADRARLETAPDNPDANLAVGRFRCLEKGDWPKGLQQLARGADATLKRLALLELDPQVEPLRVGDEWWAYADSVEGHIRTNVQRHAAVFYRRVIRDATGLTKTRLEKRLEQFPDTAGSETGIPALVLNRGYPSLQGTWNESPGIDFVVRQNGPQITATTTYHTQDSGEIRATMVGRIDKDGHLDAILRHTKAPANWKKIQKREAQLSQDGKTLSGHAAWDGGGHDFVWTRKH